MHGVNVVTNQHTPTLSRFWKKPNNLICYQNSAAHLRKAQIMPNALIAATGTFSVEKLGNQFVLDGVLYNYIKKTNFYVDSKLQDAYKASGYCATFNDAVDPYAYKYGTSAEGKEFFQKQLELPI